MEIVKKALNTINKYAMLTEGDKVLIGLSGGPDSVCLGIILQNLREDFNLTLHAVYVDHGLRPDETKREKIFCRKFCEDLGIHFLIREIEVKKLSQEKKMNVQECARKMRYQVYEEVAGELNAAKIALGHTADDQAETVLMWLLRGTGPRGLSGIPPVRQKIIRPLIEVERQDIEQFLAAYPLFKKSDTQPHYMLDSSNLNSQYLRNWIRHKMIPDMKKINPALINTMNRVAEIFREEDDYLERIVTKTLMKLISRKSDDTLELFLSPLEHMEIPLLRRVLRRALNDTKGLRGIDFIHIEDIVKLIKTGRSGDRIYLPKKIKVIRSYATLLLTSKTPVKLQTRMLEAPGKLFLEEASLMLTAEITENREKACNGLETAVIDYDMVSFPLAVRARKSGDVFWPAEFGKRKKLQDFFVDNKVPRDERPGIPLVTTHEDIVWVAGYRMDERFKASEKTKKFLVLKIFKV